MESKWSDRRVNRRVNRQLSEIHVREKEIRIKIWIEIQRGSNRDPEKDSSEKVWNFDSRWRFLWRSNTGTRRPKIIEDPEVDLESTLIYWKINAISSGRFVNWAWNQAEENGREWRRMKENNWTYWRAKGELKENNWRFLCEESKLFSSSIRKAASEYLMAQY